MGVDAPRLPRQRRIVASRSPSVPPPEAFFRRPGLVLPGNWPLSHVSPEELGRSGVLVRIPSALLSFTGGQDEILLEAGDLASLLRRLDGAFPGIRDRIVDETGKRREFVNLFVNDELVRGSLESASLRPGDAVHILPSVAGG